MPRVLMIDDEPGIRRLVARALSSAGFVVDCAADGQRGLELASEGRHELVVLDLLLPGIDGVTVLRRLMAHQPRQRVLILSAVGDVGSRVQCLDLGAADYLLKPFAVAELIARVRARLRPDADGDSERWLHAGKLTLDTTRRAAEIGGRSVSLSQREFLLLEHLIRRVGEVCGRDQLLADVWGYSFDPGTNIVDVYVRRLRAKLGAPVIETIRNVGYCLHPS